jgi:hypothetical protein
VSKYVTLNLQSKDKKCVVNIESLKNCKIRGKEINYFFGEVKNPVDVISYNNSCR